MRDDEAVLHLVPGKEGTPLYQLMGSRSVTHVAV